LTPHNLGLLYENLTLFDKNHPPGTQISLYSKKPSKMIIFIDFRGQKEHFFITFLMYDFKVNFEGNEGKTSFFLQKTAIFRHKSCNLSRY